MKQKIVFSVIFFSSNLLLTMAILAIFSNMSCFENNILFCVTMQLTFLIIAMSIKKSSDFFVDSNDNYKVNYHSTFLLLALQVIGNSIFCILKV